MRCPMSEDANVELNKRSQRQRRGRSRPGQDGSHRPITAIHILMLRCCASDRMMNQDTTDESAATLSLHLVELVAGRSSPTTPLRRKKITLESQFFLPTLTDHPLNPRH